MAKARKGRKVTEGAEIDLTPMIDVVFQLIIFFMVVTQITSQENVNLRLPDALAANEEEDDAKKLFTVHIAPVNQSSDADLPEEFGWFCYGEPTPKNIDEMRTILDAEGSLVDPDRELEGRPDPATGISENMILVRCDARAPAREFGRLIEMMAVLKIYRIKIAIMKDQKVE